MLLVLASCTSHPNGGGDGLTLPSDATTESGSTDWIPATDQPTFVTVNPPWELYGSPLFADLDGDGLVDMLGVSIDRAAGNATQEWIVLGPLDAVHLPAGAWVTIDTYADWITPLELNGEDGIDLVTTSGATSKWMHPFPYDGTLPPADGWIAVDPYQFTGLSLDIDGDGTTDQIRSDWTEAEGEVVELTWGPFERWSGPPDVWIEPVCRDDVVYEVINAVYNVGFPGDLDSDGAAELVFVPYGWAKGGGDCGDFTVSLPQSGTIDPFDSPLSVDRLGDVQFQPIGDWTGDGLSELWAPTSHTLLTSPVTLTPEGVVGTTEDVTSWTIESLEPQPFDLDGDGRPEVLAKLLDDGVAFLPPDLDLLADPEAPQVWDLGGGWPQTYVDRGHAWLVVTDLLDLTQLRRIDLGPATAL